uniref:DNA repair protein RAD51 homolog 2-like n=1 Tax=Myxine glutinosa TaxID=7769 RepID=UPI00358E1F53
MTGRSYEDLSQLMMTISKHCCPKTTTALEIKQQHKQQSAFLPTSLASLDNALCGGLACGSVTEVSGPPGCGKTQLCMMLSVLATLPMRMGGLDSPVIYIDTEGAFSPLRLMEIAQKRYSEYFACQERLLEMTGRVHLYREFSTQHIMDRIEARILLTNQITVRFNDRPKSALEITEEPSVEESFVTAALGASWGHSANTRLVLQFLNTQQRQDVEVCRPYRACHPDLLSVMGAWCRENHPPQEISHQQGKRRVHLIPAVLVHLFGGVMRERPIAKHCIFLSIGACTAER